MPKKVEKNLRGTMEKKKRILFVEYFSFIGGGQIVLLNLIKSLKKYYDIKVLLLNEGQLSKELQKLKIDYHLIQAPQKIKYRYFWQMFPAIFKIYRYIKEMKPDLIYANCFFAIKLLSPAIRLLKIKTIWHKHVIIEKKYNSYLAGQIRKYSKIADVIICVSNAVKKSLVDIGVDKDKLKVIYNGIKMPDINMIKVRKEIRKKYKIGDKFLIGSIGFFRENKGFDIFIKCAGELKKLIKNLKFMLVGKSDMTQNSTEKNLKQLAKDSGLEKDFIFAGYIEKYKILPAFDLFVLPSHAEPFGLVTLEALSLGIPVVAFATGGTKEIIKNGYNGFLVKKLDYKDLSKKIVNILQNRKKLKTIRSNAKKTIIEKFNIKNQILKMVKIIDKYSCKT